MSTYPRYLRSVVSKFMSASALPTLVAAFSEVYVAPSVLAGELDALIEGAKESVLNNSVFKLLQRFGVVVSIES